MTAADQPTAPPLLPVDRHWLAKLLHKHGHQLPAQVLAPMVDQSDLAFRLQCRRYGTNLAFTPMIHARLYSTVAEYRRKFGLESIPAADRPLIAQLCGSDLESVIKCAVAVAPYCDGIDINCGCPQSIAKRGQYGAFLLEDRERLLTLVKRLLPVLPVPLSVKVRLLPAPTRDESIKASLDLYAALVDAGVHMLTVHGRTRFQKGADTGAADWKAIRLVVERLGDRIPILANGSIESWHQAEECTAVTGADGVMSSEAILEYPPLFSRQPKVGRLALAREYLQLATEYPPNIGGQGSGIKCIRAHVHRMLHDDLQTHVDLRQALVDANSIEELSAACDLVQKRHEQESHVIEDERLGWYNRHRQLKIDQYTGTTINLTRQRMERDATIKVMELQDDTGDCFAYLFDEQ